MTDINKYTSGDKAHVVARALLGAIPYAGAAATELLGLILTPPIEKRREQWMREIGEKLKELAEKEIDISGLGENPQFIDTVLQATALALKTSDQEKITALKNAIINTVLGEAPDLTLSQIFLNLIDNFTAWHIKILHLFNDPSDWFKNNNVPLPSYISASLKNIATDAFPELNGYGELIDLIWSDLNRAGLTNTTSLSSMMSGNGLLAVRTTEMGKQFLKYIATKNLMNSND